jgi:hypothetical protein
VTAPRPFTLNKSATADAAGTAVVRFTGPGDAWNVITVDVISLQSDSAGLPEARLYRGDPASGVLMGIAPDGLTGGFAGGGAADVLGPSDVWSIQWVGADPGSTCTAALSGVERRR